MNKKLPSKSKKAIIILAIIAVAAIIFVGLSTLDIRLYRIGLDTYNNDLASWAGINTDSLSENSSVGCDTIDEIIKRIEDTKEVSKLTQKDRLILNTLKAAKNNEDSLINKLTSLSAAIRANSALVLATMRSQKAIEPLFQLVVKEKNADALYYSSAALMALLHEYAYTPQTAQLDLLFEKYLATGSDTYKGRNQRKAYSAILAFFNHPGMYDYLYNIIETEPMNCTYELSDIAKYSESERTTDLVSLLLGYCLDEIPGASLIGNNTQNILFGRYQRALVEILNNTKYRLIRDGKVIEKVYLESSQLYYQGSYSGTDITEEVLTNDTDLENIVENLFSKMNVEIVNDIKEADLVVGVLVGGYSISAKYTYTTLYSGSKNVCEVLIQDLGNFQTYSTRVEYTRETPKHIEYVSSMPYQYPYQAPFKQDVVLLIAFSQLFGEEVLAYGDDFVLFKQLLKHYPRIDTNIAYSMN